MVAWEEMNPVLLELRIVVAHCPKQNVARRTDVLQAIFLVEEGLECLVDLCNRAERVFSHQSVLEELLQGPVVANEASHCVNFQEGGGFFGMSVHRRCALGDDSPSLPTHVGVGSSLSHSFVSSSVFSRNFLFVDTQRFQRPEADVCAGRGAAPHDESSGLTRTDSVERAKHRAFVSIVQRFICTKRSRLSKRLFEKSRDTCWDKSCRLEVSSAQLLSLALHLTWNLIWWQRQSHVNLRIVPTA